MHPFPDHKILFSAQQIHENIARIAKQIETDYLGQNLILICITNGSIPFVADLMRKISLPLRLDSMRINSGYHNATKPTTEPLIVDAFKIDVQGQHILLVDDILDTGNTLHKVAQYIQEKQPASLKTCVLLDKKERRQAPIEADYACFSIPDKFVVGFGLDYQEHYRNLPYIAVLT